jgi:hypothetical protein
MTDAEWAVGRAHCHRAALDAIRYLVDSGIKWQVIENRDRAVSFRSVG